MRLLLLVVLAGCSAGVPLPPAAAALNAAGVEALAAGDLESADARFALALEYSPRFVEALVNLGLVELERGNFTRARLLFERARRTNPDMAQPHHALGVLAERERRPDRASAHYYEALRVDPGFAPARDNLARVLFAGGLVEEALVQYQRLVELVPDEPRAAAGLVETLVRLRRFDEADRRLESARKKSPETPELVLLEARRALREGRVTAALDALAPLVERHDELGARALGFLAMAELAQQKPEQAAVAARRALALVPEDAVATYALALALGTLGSPDARAWVRRARRATPSDPLLAELDRALAPH
ncbi:MAG TPA: tetratricopeptide repeat protein [Polyangiaceae bacterium]|nr:tetratricopeptide repeat protein [Polyangiaceae bacterium]